MSAFGLLCIRSGSKGIPGKNIASVAGKPLFYWILKAAFSTSCLKYIYASSDSEIYLNLVKRYFPEVILLKRPDHLALDTSLEVDVVRYHVDNLYREEELSRDDVIVRLHATSPLQTSSDIESTVELLLSDYRLSSSILVKKCTYAPEKLLYLEHSPDVSFPLARSVEDGTSESVTPRNRQDYTLRYQRANIIASYVRTILDTRTLTGPMCGAVIASGVRIDIDSPEDLLLASLMIEYNLSHESPDTTS